MVAFSLAHRAGVMIPHSRQPVKQGAIMAPPVVRPEAVRIASAIEDALIRRIDQERQASPSAISLGGR